VAFEIVAPIALVEALDIWDVAFREPLENFRKEEELSKHPVKLGYARVAFAIGLRTPAVAAQAVWVVPLCVQTWSRNA